MNPILTAVGIAIFIFAALHLLTPSREPGQTPAIAAASVATAAFWMAVLWSLGMLA